MRSPCRAMKWGRVDTPVVPSAMKHIDGNLWEIESPDFGLINIGFVEEDDGSVSAITIDSYDFSFVAFKKNQ